MKYVLILTLFSFSSFAKSITVTGPSASELVDVADYLGISEHGMGKVDFQVRKVECEKIVNDTISKSHCTFLNITATNKAGLPMDITTSKLENPSSPDAQAQLLRVLLSHVTGNEKIVSQTRKVVKVSSIKCHGSGISHWMDGLTIEENYKCEINY